MGGCCDKDMLKNKETPLGAEITINGNPLETIENEYARIIEKVNIEDSKTKVNALIR